MFLQDRRQRQFGNYGALYRGRRLPASPSQTPAQQMVGWNFRFDKFWGATLASTDAGSR
jgi:hypothetical protein